MADLGTSSPRWWTSPAAIGLGALVVVCSLAAVFEDKLVPPKKADPRSHVVLPGGGTFCDPLPVPPAPPSHNIPPLR
jgi:hypothetical protein